MVSVVLAVELSLCGANVCVHWLSLRSPRRLAQAAPDRTSVWRLPVYWMDGGAASCCVRSTSKSLCFLVFIFTFRSNVLDVICVWKGRKGEGAGERGDDHGAVGIRGGGQRRGSSFCSSIPLLLIFLSPLLSLFSLSSLLLLVRLGRPASSSYTAVAQSTKWTKCVKRKSRFLLSSTALSSSSNAKSRQSRFVHLIYYFSIYFMTEDPQQQNLIIIIAPDRRVDRTSARCA